MRVLRPASYPEAARLAEVVTVHSLTWLVVANAVGCWLATVLLWPKLGNLVAPFTYGRLMPLHLDLHLYGWCSLPLVGLLLRLYLPAMRLGRAGELAVGLWSAALAFGAVSWLAGESSGKLFLDWTGAARLVLAISLTFLAVVLAVAWWRQATARETDGKPRSGDRAALIGRGVFALFLLAVPWVLFWSASPAVYPSINPDSGGATGGSLLGSTLGIVALIFAVPYLLGLAASGAARTSRWVLTILAVHGVWFAVLDHGDHSHHELLQLLSLTSLVLWWPLLYLHLRRFAWPRASRGWTLALAVWGAFLVLTGVVDFLPGVLERLKFTNALVAHAHIAMAGLVSSLHALILISLAPAPERHPLAEDRRAFQLWHGGNLVLAAALLFLGALESGDPGLLYLAPGIADVLYAVRWLGGLLMLVASARWLAAALGERAWTCEDADQPSEEEPTSCAA